MAQARGGLLHSRGWGVRCVALLAILVLVTSCGSSGAGSSGKKVSIGSKGFTEQLIVAEMAAALLENDGYKVERNLNLSTTQICHESLTKGSIDMYIEYTGTGLLSVLNLPPQSDPQGTYDTVKKAYAEQFKVNWLQPWGFNDTYALVMKQDKANQLGIKTISDLQSKANDLVLGSGGEFFTRPDGLPGLEKAYGIKFKEERSMDPGIMYQAVAGDQVDVIAGFSTDGRIPTLNLVVLQDDKKFFPPYFAAPVVRQGTLDKNPGMADLLNKLAGKIDDQTMAGLNAQVDQDKKEPADVAKAFLKQQGLIK
jgi:glycine betaine/choline ABC-type transport system substrate-binding protein